MRRAIAPIALACAAFAAIPAAAESVTVSARSRGPAVEVYIEAQTRGVAPAVLYNHARSERRLVARSALPPVGTFAYFGSGGATEVAVVTEVRIDGTVTLLHHDPYGYATEIQMNLRYPGYHRRGGRIINDYVSFSGSPSLAPVIFYGYSQPPPRVIVISAPHGGHRGGVGPRDSHEHERMTCLPAGHPGRGHAYGRCKNHGAHPRPVHARYDDDDRWDHGHHHHDDDHSHYADRGRDRDDDDDHKHGKKKKNKKSKKKDKKHDGKRDDKRGDRDHDNRARKRIDL